MVLLKKNIRRLRPNTKSLEEGIRAQSKIFSHLSATGFAVLLVLALSQFDLYGLRGMLLDLVFRANPAQRPNPRIALVAYDDESAIRYHESGRIPVEELTRLFEVLAPQKPLAVAVLANIDEKRYSDAELNTIATAFALIPNTYVGYTDDTSLGQSAPPSLLRTARYFPGFVSRDTFSFGADSVTRRVMIDIEGIPTVYAKLAELAGGRGQLDPSRFERFSESRQTFINWQGPPGTYTAQSSVSVVQGATAPDTYKDKIVLISSSLQSRKGEDHIFTPYSRKHFETTRLEGAAHSLSTLLNNNGIYRASPLINGLLALLVAILTVNLVLYFPPGRGIFLVIGEAVILFAIAYFSLFHFDCWLNIAHPLLVACIGYYLVIPYRLVDEYHKRWHYQEKSELMAQLEQLKSNFLSLVSHDLKTPIARIQGNAELLTAGDTSGITPTQQRSLEAIIHTTEDLSHYVETVLDLTRIESSKLPLNKTTKDINATVREVVEKQRGMAEEKHIRIETSLEPLFSIKFDVKLIQQAISNLLENAIKYSPDNTTIRLISREEGDWVKVEIVDEGPGIPEEEQSKVFSKFYRGKLEAERQSEGTGLGLYLVRYFVELHEGFVELKSAVGKGSSFTLALPV